MKKIILGLCLISSVSASILADTGYGGESMSSCGNCHSYSHETGSYSCPNTCADCASRWHRTGSYSCPKKLSAVAAPSPAPQAPVIVPQPQDEEATHFAAPSAGPALPRSKDVIKKWKKLSNAEHAQIENAEFRAVLNNFRAYRFSKTIGVGGLFATYCCLLEKAIVIREAGMRSAKRGSDIATTLVEVFNCMYAIREMYLLEDDAAKEIDLLVDEVFKVLTKRVHTLEKLCEKRSSKRRLARKKNEKTVGVIVDDTPNRQFSLCGE